MTSVAMLLFEMRRAYLAAGGNGKTFVVPVNETNQASVMVLSLVLALLSPTYYTSRNQMRGKAPSIGINDALAVVYGTVSRLAPLLSGVGHACFTPGVYLNALRCNLRAMTSFNHTSWHLLAEARRGTAAEKLHDFCVCSMPRSFVSRESPFWPVVVAPVSTRKRSNVVVEPGCDLTGDDGVEGVAASYLSFDPLSPKRVKMEPLSPLLHAGDLGALFSGDGPEWIPEEVECGFDSAWADSVFLSTPRLGPVVPSIFALVEPLGGAAADAPAPASRSLLSPVPVQPKVRRFPPIPEDVPALLAPVSSSSVVTPEMAHAIAVARTVTPDMLSSVAKVEKMVKDFSDLGIDLVIRGLLTRQ